jgi:putative membrane protein
MTRNLQANERTVLAWLRTGLGFMAFGFLIERTALWLQVELHRDETFSLILANAVIATGALCHVLGALRFIAMRRALLERRSLVPGVAGPLALAVLGISFGLALLVHLLAS